MSKKSITEEQSIFSKLDSAIVETLKKMKEDYSGRWLVAGLMESPQNAVHYAQRIREAIPEIEALAMGSIVYTRF